MWNTKIPCKMACFSSTVWLVALVEHAFGWCYARPPDDPRRARGRVEHPAETRADDLWNAIAGRLRDTLTDTAYDTWFGEARPQSVNGGRLVVEVPNDFTRDWIEGHFVELVARAAAQTGSDDAVVSFAVSERSAMRAATVPEVVVEQPQPRLPQAVLPEPGPRESTEVELNPKYTFDLFVIGSSNRFAHAAALAVAEAPAQAYNPLFIYGGTGLGKTHLLQAIGHYVRQHSRRLTTRYVTSETFMNEFIDAVRERGTRIEGFKRRYRNYDVLLVDDIQFIEGKERIQEEFFHTFNSLYEGGAQIIISSDRPPREIATLEERLRSRFEWGLLTDIQAPDLETRIAILRKRVETEGIAIDGSGGAHLHRESCLREHPRARGRAHARRRLLVADRQTAHGRSRGERPEGRVPARRGRRRRSRSPGSRRPSPIASE